ncbi:MAG: hypothetical protein FJ123_00925 [Deltaproteobacteria bacterium]|nr:hypothetical protein [Deltaproteobacteria bacterium]
MLTLLISFLPQEAWILVLMAGGFLIMLGFRKLGFSLVGIMILLAIFFPFLESFVLALPAEIQGLLFLVFCFFVVRLLLGRRIFENILSRLIYDLIKIPFKFVAWFFRVPNRRA